MPLDPAQRHQIEQDAITAAWEAERIAACDDAIVLLREIADLQTDDNGEVIIGQTPMATTICCRASPLSLPATTNRGTP